MTKIKLANVFLMFLHFPILALKSVCMFGESFFLENWRSVGWALSTMVPVITEIHTFAMH